MTFDWSLSTGRNAQSSPDPDESPQSCCPKLVKFCRFVANFGVLFFKVQINVCRICVNQESVRAMCLTLFYVAELCRCRMSNVRWPFVPPKSVSTITVLLRCCGGASDVVYLKDSKIHSSELDSLHMKRSCCKFAWSGFQNTIFVVTCIVNCYFVSYFVSKLY